MLQDYFMHIHYCNGGRHLEPGRFSRQLTRTLSHHELMYICDGSGHFRIHGKNYTLGKGMLLYICPNEPYSFRMDADKPVGCLTVHFSCADIHFDDGVWNICSGSSVLARRSVWKLRNPHLIESQFQNLLSRWNEKLPGYAFVTRTLLQQMIIDITRDLHVQSTNRTASVKVEAVIEYMRRHIEEKLTLPALVAVVGISPAYLSRIFKEATGCTIIEYFNKMKIDVSKEFLLEGMKVREVASKLGFADEFYFSRLFKRLEGVSPSEFYSRIVHEN